MASLLFFIYFVLEGVGVVWCGWGGGVLYTLKETLLELLRSNEKKTLPFTFVLTSQHFQWVVGLRFKLASLQALV